MEVTAGALTRLELNEWGAAEMGLQKALESDGWINPDASHGALHRQPRRNGGLAGAESAPGAAGAGTGVGGDPTAGVP